MNYKEYIDNILNTRGRFACGNKYHEKHHIIPKCIGGTDDEENLIDLLAREHFEAHRLLALENLDNKKLVHAWWTMTNFKNQYQNRHITSAVEYEEAKKIWSKKYSESISGANHWDVSGENNPMYGKHHTEETKKKISQANAGKLSSMKGKKHSKNTRKNMSIKAKERLKNKENHNMYGKHHTEETKQKISESAKERFTNKENHPMYGKHHTEETKQKISEKIKGKYSGENNSNARKVIRLFDLRVYDYLLQAAQENNVARSTMRRYCKTRNGFMYYDEYLLLKGRNL